MTKYPNRSKSETPNWIKEECQHCGDPYWVIPSQAGKFKFCSKECRYRPTEELFWAKVDKNGPIPEGKPELGNCWLWTAGKNGFGYGYMKVNGDDLRAHSLSWVIHGNTKPIFPLLLMHLCNVRHCVNPAHLKPGTQSENIQQCSDDGRMDNRKGELCPTASFTNAQSSQIREEAKTIPQKCLALKYGVSESVISNIVNFKTYSVDSVKESS